MQQSRKKLGSYNTCHIDRVYGQAWCTQLDMPRINSQEKVVSALKALWKYNFIMDVGPYIKTHLGGRPYALWNADRERILRRRITDGVK